MELFLKISRFLGKLGWFLFFLGIIAEIVLFIISLFKFKNDPSILLLFLMFGFTIIAGLLLIVFSFLIKQTSKPINPEEAQRLFEIGKNVIKGTREALEYQLKIEKKKKKKDPLGIRK